MRRRIIWIERPEVYLRGERCFGVAHHDTWTIELDPAHCGSPRQILLTECHELGHLLFPSLRERDIGKKFEFLAAELWKRGYRRKP
jgi:hypothetical protein